jgi:peptidoglycan-associated lipoprotein
VTIPKSQTLSAALVALMTALLGACSSTPVAEPTPATQAAATAAPAAKPATAPQGATQPAPASRVATVTLPAHLDPQSDISTGRSIYFDYDVSAIKPEYTGLLERHGRYLIANAKLAIKLEGHTDERGSTEYNLALGQRRAESVRRALSLIGVKDAQMEAISWGKEKPKASGHDEAAWAQNRRVDLQYPGR